MYLKLFLLIEKIIIFAQVFFIHLVGKTDKYSPSRVLARLSLNVCSSTNVLTHSTELFSHLISLADEMEN